MTGGQGDSSGGGANPRGRTLKFFELEGTPMRQMAPNRWPEILRNGKWEPYWDIERFHLYADPVDEDEWRDFVILAGGPDPDEPEHVELPPDEIKRFGKEVADELKTAWDDYLANGEGT